MKGEKGFKGEWPYTVHSKWEGEFENMKHVTKKTTKGK